MEKSGEIYMQIKIKIIVWRNTWFLLCDAEFMLLHQAKVVLESLVIESYNTNVIHRQNFSTLALLFLTHQSVKFCSQEALVTRTLWLTPSLCFTAHAKQWTMHPVTHPPTGYSAKSTNCLAYFSLLFSNGAYPMKH